MRVDAENTQIAVGCGDWVWVDPVDKGLDCSADCLDPVVFDDCNWGLMNRNWFCVAGVATELVDMSVVADLGWAAVASSVSSRVAYGVQAFHLLLEV